MRFLIPLATLALLVSAIGSSNAHANLPMNVLTNAGFESGLTGWSVKGTGSLAGAGLTSPGAEGSARAVLVKEVGTGSAWLHQDMAPVAASPVSLLDFHAKIVANLANPMPQGIRVAAGHNPATGLAEIIAGVDFRGGSGQLLTFCNGLTGPCTWTTFAPPTDGQWHHYQLVLLGATGLGVLLVDGLPVATHTGDPASVTAPTRVLFGDLAYFASGKAPDVAWDEIYYGPSL